MIYASPLLALLLFYWGFAAAVGVYRQWLSGKLNAVNKIAFLPLLIGFWLVDVALNYTAALVFMGLPDKKTDYTLSSRFETYRAEHTTGYRLAVANFMCEVLLNNIDPSGSHC
jgi:hypothetical protein